MDEGTCLIDSSFRVVRATARFTELVGREASGELVYELTPWLAHLQHTDVPGERRLLVRGERTRVRIEPITGADGPTGAHMLVTVRDMSEQKRTEDELRVSKHVLQSLIDACPIAITALDRGMKVKLWNPAAETITGWKRDEVIGKAYPLVPDDKIEEFRTLFLRVLSGEGFAGIEATRQHKDGTTLELEISTAPMRDATGAVNGAMALLHDVSERKRLERRAAEGQKMEALGRLAGGVAHDFNNLLTVIAGSADIIAAKPGEADRPLDDIRVAAQRASMLTKKLLAFSRRQILKPRVIDLSTVLRDTARMLDRLIGDDIDLSVSSDDGAGAILIDEGQLELVLVNLAVNARDAMPEGGQLTIRSSRRTICDAGSTTLAPGDYIEVSVRDTGHGVPESIRDKIFEPFFTTKEEGTGLGLATVHGIVEQSGGAIEVVAEPGKGSCFRVLLPRVERSNAAAVESTPGQPTGNAELVLLVEDHEAVRLTVQRMLEALGYRVIATDGPEAALSELSNDAIALLFTDMAMPKMSGIELARRAMGLRPDLPVVFSSGNVDSAIERHGLAKTHARIMAKPFSMAKLATVVREALDGEPGI